MIIQLHFLVLLLVLISNSVTIKPEEFVPKIKYERKDLKKRLPKEVFMITQDGYQELSQTGGYWNHIEDGQYDCIVCNEPLFDSEHKIVLYDKRSNFIYEGIPVFEKALAKATTIIETKEWGRKAYQAVWCTTCGSKLGTIGKNDKRQQLGGLYLINSAALEFKDRNLIRPSLSDSK